ncbi:MAG: helix-turn-helix domain-containing protein [Pseudorhodoplanes sp.]|nr:helix-turn-helix domain-containing protein [Pseudorhodoplanes sp.]
MSARTKASSTKITRSSGNIFADIGLADVDEHELKAHIVICISRTIAAKKLTQTEAAKRMGVAQPDLSKILRGNFSGFSLERLLGFVRALGSDVEIKIKPPRNKHEGRLILTPA